jgi:hypothetical protein
MIANLRPAGAKIGQPYLKNKNTYKRFRVMT